MAHYYKKSASLHYSFFNIVIRWCVFYCLWNLWTLPRLEAADERGNFSMTILGNDTIVQESLPIRVINGRKAILISQLWGRLSESADSESETGTRASERKAPLAQLTFESSAPASRESQPALKNTRSSKLIEERQPRFPKGHQKLTKYQMTAKATRSHAHATSSEIASMSPTQTKEPPSKMMPAVRRLRRASTQSHLQQSTRITSQQQPRRSALALLVFCCAFTSGGIFALRALKRLERWEIQSQKDKLAYDIGYTTKREANYGSFESRSWQDDFSKYDHV